MIIINAILTHLGNFLYASSKGLRIFSMLVIVGVPFSFLTAIIYFPIFGITISTMALVGFIMVSGMVVDGAIILWSQDGLYRIGGAE